MKGELIAVNGLQFDKFPLTEEGLEAAQEFGEKIYLVQPTMRKTSAGELEETLTSRRLV